MFLFHRISFPGSPNKILSHEMKFYFCLNDRIEITPKMGFISGYFM